jgi:hypothetical protein
MDITLENMDFIEGRINDIKKTIREIELLKSIDLKKYANGIGSMHISCSQWNNIYDGVGEFQYHAKMPPELHTITILAMIELKEKELKSKMEKINRL